MTHKNLFILQLSFVPPGGMDMLRKIVLASALAIFSTSAWGQTTNASISGSVADSSGAVLPGVAINATNARTGVSGDTVTNESGVYQFPSLQTGTYKLSAELPGTKLIRGANVNEVNIFENGILDAFNVTAAGGNAPLFDRMLNGLNLGLGPVNGTTVTGSASLRGNTTTNAFLANNNAGGLANFLNTTTNFTGVAGGLLRNGSLPENFIVVNPQYRIATLTGNFANSTYNSMVLEVVKRFSSDWTLTTNYTWSRTLGEHEGSDQVLIDNYRTIRDRSVDKKLLGFHRTHNFTASGTYELPFGPGKRFLNAKSGILSRLIERWQFGGIMRRTSGSPISITSATSSFNGETDNTATVVGVLPINAGRVTRVANGVVYFPDLKQVRDPAVAALTTQQGLQSRSNMLAIADANGQIVLVNPAPGTLGTLRTNSLEGPGEFSVDLNLVKRVVIKESKNLEIRIDAINALNHPNFGNPNTNINSNNFGQITTTTGSGTGSTGSRIIVLNLRLNF
jgi:hypothetical protein